jgi:hypothetical protein
MVVLQHRVNIHSYGQYISFLGLLEPTAINRVTSTIRNLFSHHSRGWRSESKVLAEPPPSKGARGVSVPKLFLVSGAADCPWPFSELLKHHSFPSCILTWCCCSCLCLCVLSSMTRGHPPPAPHLHLITSVKNQLSNKVNP